MKTEQQIREARRIVCDAIDDSESETIQRVLLQGMSVALQWVCEDGGDTLQRLVDGEQVQRTESEEQR